MPEAAVTTAYHVSRGKQPQREWLRKTAQQFEREAAKRQMFFLRFTAGNATLRPATFRVPNRDYPFLVTGASVNRAVSSIRMFSADDEVANYSIPIDAFAGGSDQRRKLFKWPEPLLLLPHTAWRLELTLTDPAGIALNTVIVLRGVRIK